MSWSISIEGRLGKLDFALRIETAEPLLVVVGPNGAGKTTLLRAVAGAALPLDASVTLEGRSLDRPPEERRVGYVPQGYGLFPHLTVAENVAFGARGEVPQPLIERFELSPLLGRRPAELSGGEQQRVALARALASEPRCLLLDEPLAALDAKSRRSMRRFLADHLRTEALPAIVVTHDARDLFALDGHVVVVEAGRVVQEGRVAELVDRPSGDFVTELLDTGVSTAGM